MPQQAMRVGLLGTRLQTLIHYRLLGGSVSSSCKAKRQMRCST